MRSASAREAARQRHPVSQWHPDYDRLRQRMQERLRARGHPAPARAAMQLAVRGRLGIDRATFAGLAGVTEAEVEALERGEQRPEEAARKVVQAEPHEQEGGDG